jgi:hypothetical protein
VYIGGTLSAVKEKSYATIDVKGEENFVRSPKGVAPVQIPWGGIHEVECGQKVGHRVKTATFLTPLAEGRGRQEPVGGVRVHPPGAGQHPGGIGKDSVYQDEQAKKQMGAPTEK